MTKNYYQILSSFSHNSHIEAMADHRPLYKNSALDAKELRRRREDTSTQLRRQKREETVSKRRTLPDSDLPQNHNDCPEYKNYVEPEIGPDFSINDEVIKALNQDENVELIIVNAQKVRKALSKEPQPPFDDVIQKGLLPRLVQLLDRNDNTTIQFEVSWVLTNICSGTTYHTKAVVDAGAVPKLVQLLLSSDVKVCEQAVWALGNIIGDGPYFRDLVIDHNFIPILLSIIRSDLDIGFLRNITWVLVNLCRNKQPGPNIHVIETLVPALSFLITATDLYILIDTTWAISYIAELGPNYSQLIIDSQLVGKISPLIAHTEVKIQTAAIRALGSIVTGSDEQTQSVIDAGALDHLKRLFELSRDKVVKEALWFLSNIAAGSVTQIQSIIDSKLIPFVINHLEQGDYNQQKEAAWIVYNMILSGTPSQLQELVDENVVPCLSNLLTLADKNVVKNTIEALSTLLKVLSETNPNLVYDIEKCGAVDRVEHLQQDPNEEIYKVAYDFIDTHYGVEKCE